MSIKPGWGDTQEQCRLLYGQQIVGGRNHVGGAFGARLARVRGEYHCKRPRQFRRQIRQVGCIRSANQLSKRLNGGRRGAHYGHTPT